jgi:BirA family biotin operon repressor/biotin-[acetyl-CoA-carboxylase] ligase
MYRCGDGANIGRVQYRSGQEKGLASLQGLGTAEAVVSCRLKLVHMDILCSSVASCKACLRLCVGGAGAFAVQELELLKSAPSPRHLTLVWARRQTQGRGRGGRVWQSPEGNVFFSMILRPQADWGDLNQLPLVTSVAIHAAIRPHVPSSRALTIKWPNDLLIDAAKVSGTLIESPRLIRSTDINRWSAEALVVGIGVNVAHHPTEGLIYPATSLRQAGSAVERDQVIRDLAQALIEALELWRRRGFAPIRAAYLESAHGLGESITVRTSLDLDESISGVFEGIDEDGACCCAWLTGPSNVCSPVTFSSVHRLPIRATQRRHHDNPCWTMARPERRRTRNPFDRAGRPFHRSLPDQSGVARPQCMVRRARNDRRHADRIHGAVEESI